jgi:hypothetical protein
MTLPRPYLQYLLLDTNQYPALGNLRWSDSGDSIITEDGGLFCFTQQLAEFIDGFSRVARLIPLEQILVLLRLFIGNEPCSPSVSQVRRLYRELGQPLANAGVLAAELSIDLPRANTSLDGRAIATWLRESSSQIELARNAAYPLAEVSPISADDFERIIHARLVERSTTVIRHYLRHGITEPSAAQADATLDLIHARPRSLLDRITAIAQQSDRISQSLRLVPILEGALSLPYRKPATPLLPVGGYADVVNRGLPDQLVLSQFALDDDEFVRRFAENELLYYQHERAYRPQCQRLILLIDQGIRTWGRARIALAAAVQTFAKWCHRHRLELWIGTTELPDRLVDPQLIPDPELMNLLESSDFTVSVVDLLRHSLAQIQAHDADLIVLTHPLSLTDPAVTTALVALPETSRLFAVTADESGAVALQRWGRPGWLRVAGCRVDVDDVSAVNMPSKTDSHAASPRWAGDVCPLPMPFAFGPLNPVGHLVFDLSEEKVLCLTRTGQALCLDTVARVTEVLPDPKLQLKALDPFLDAVATECGFAVLTQSEDNHCHLVIYDLYHRHIQVIQDFNASSICYLQHLNTVVSRSLPSQAIDLATLGRWPCLSGHNSALTSRARLACAEPKHQLPPTKKVRVLVGPESFADYRDEPAIMVDPASSTIRILGTLTDWPAIDARLDGIPMVQKQNYESAELVKDVAAIGFVANNRSYILLLERNLRRNSCILRRADNSVWTLAPNTRKIAYIKPITNDVCIRDFKHNQDLLDQPPRVISNRVLLRGNNTGLELIHGRYQHLVDWSSTTLQVSIRAGASSYVKNPAFVEAVPASNAQVVDTFHNIWTGNRVGSILQFKKLMAVLDIYNQVYVFRVDPSPTLLAVFYVKRQYLCGWLPDNTRFGDPLVSGHPASTQPMQRFGAALACLLD